MPGILCCLLCLAAGQVQAPNASIFTGLSPTDARALEAANLGKTMSRVDATIAAGPFKPDWASLHQHQDPEWFRDAKFGIYTHWGPVTVGSTSAGAEWYGNQLYQPADPSFKWHQQHIGDQRTAGFKAAVPHFTAEKFDADQWADIVFRSGAKFAGPVAMHHDNFALWNSSLTRWNAANMGPHRDIVGELEKAYRKRGLRFITSFHHGFAWRYFEPSFAYDGANAIDSDLYTTVHAPGAPPSQEFQDLWLGKVYEVLEKYQPDLIYFDFEFSAVITPEYEQKLFAAAYDWASQHGREMAVTQKDRAVHEHTGVLDFERGREDRITPYPWLTDTALGSWFYVETAGFRDVTSTVGILVDIVSKNGCMMMDIGPKVDGTLPQAGVDVLLGVGAWLKTNGEAIYSSRPWLVYGEGPTRNGGGGFSESKEQPYTSRDLRFTQSKDGRTLYAIALGWPEGEFTIEKLQVDATEAGASVDLLGSGPVKWRVNESKQLVIQPPAKKVGDHAYAFRLTGFRISLQDSARFDEPTATQLEPGGATLEGGKIQAQENDGRANIGFWDNPQDRIHWLLRIPAAGVYDVRGEFSSATGPSGLKLTVDQQSFTAQVPQTDGWFKPVFVSFGALKFDRPGVYHVILEPADPAKWHAVNVYRLQVAPRG